MYRLIKNLIDTVMKMEIVQVTLDLLAKDLTTCVTKILRFRDISLNCLEHGEITGRRKSYLGIFSLKVFSLKFWINLSNLFSFCSRCHRRMNFSFPLLLTGVSASFSTRNCSKCSCLTFLGRGTHGCEYRGSLITIVLGSSLDYCVAWRYSASVNPGTRDVYCCEHRR